MPMHHDHIPGHTPHDESHEKREHARTHAAKHHGKQTEADTEAIEEGLQAIYGDDRSDLHVVERDGSRLTRLLTRTVIFLAIVAVLAFGGFFLYSNFLATNVSSQPLIMNIEVPPEVKSGEKTQILVNYANPSRIPVASLELDVNLPSSFVLAICQERPT